MGILNDRELSEMGEFARLKVSKFIDGKTLTPEQEVRLTHLTHLREIYKKKIDTALAPYV